MRQHFCDSWHHKQADASWLPDALVKWAFTSGSGRDYLVPFDKGAQTLSPARYISTSRRYSHVARLVLQ